MSDASFFMKLATTTIGMAVFLAAQSHAVPTIAKGYYEDAAGRFCTSGTSCTILFSPVPAGNTFIASNLSCSISIFSTSAVSVTQLVLSGNTKSTQLGDHKPFLSGGKTIVTFNEELLKIFSGDQRPAVTITLALPNSMTMSCNIVGKISL